MTQDVAKEPVYTLPLIVAAILAALAAEALFLFLQDRTQTALFVAVIGAVVAIDRMLQRSGLYHRWKIR